MDYESQLTFRLINQVKRTLRIPVVACLAVILALSTAANAQDEKPVAPPEETPSARVVQSDVVLPHINALAQGVTTPKPDSLSKALHIGEKPKGVGDGMPPNTLASAGDLDGDGVREMILKWAIPDAELAADLAPIPDSKPLWSTYLLSWDGAHWRASSLLNGIGDFTFRTITLGRSRGRGLAVVAMEGDPPMGYPAVFQVKNHAAELLWDAQADDSQYEPLAQGEVEFQDRGAAPAELIVTGRADPGLLQFNAKGHRGFTARAVYHWSGKAYVPGKTEYFADQDYTLYRFISALHLHDYHTAYGLIEAEKFLHTDSPSVDALHKFIEDTWPEFLADQIFQAVEPPPGAAMDYAFVGMQPDKVYRYQPVFSNDGKFLLREIKRSTEARPSEPPIP